MARFLKIALVCALPFVVLGTSIVAETATSLEHHRCVTIVPPNTLSPCSARGDAACRQIYGDTAECSGACLRCDSAETIPRRSCIRWYNHTCKQTGESKDCPNDLTYDLGECSMVDNKCICVDYHPTLNKCGTYYACE